MLCSLIFGSLFLWWCSFVNEASVLLALSRTTWSSHVRASWFTFSVGSLTNYRGACLSMRSLDFVFLHFVYIMTWRS
ncbi:hypothetical protein BVRB_2g030530 isoform B [Beta vulgaris subsp. vulgaris]|nr:hypothetical protein BVRB_2g030530 isoform B [Beta vulgaris subsp. vulgaris]